jgi:hypothetical protein
MGSHKAGNRVQTGEEKMRLRIFCILVILLAVAVAIAPVLGFTDSPNGGNDTDVLSSYTNIIVGCSGNNTNTNDYYIQKFSFTKIQTFNFLESVKYFAGYGGWKWALSNTTSNSSYTSANGAVLSYGPYNISNGRFGYSIDLSNRIYIYYLANSWDRCAPGFCLNGTVDLNLTYDRSLFDLYHNIYQFSCYAVLNGSDYEVAFKSNAYVLPGEYWNDYKEVASQSLMNIKYIREPHYPQDLFYIYRHSDNNPTPTYSTVNLSYSTNNGATWNSVYTNYGTDDNLTLYLPNGTRQQLWILSPVNNRVFLYQWNAGAVSNCSGDSITVNTWDGSTGAQLGGTKISFINTTNYIGNISVTAPNGTYTFCLPPYFNYDVGASKTGYEGANTTWTSAIYFGDQIDFWLYPVTNDTFNGTATFIVNDVYGLPISNVKIVSTNNDIRYTNNQGYTQFIVNRTATYSYTASKSGYNSSTVDVTLGGAASKITEIRLTAGVIPTATTPVTTVVTPTLPPGTGEAATQEVSSIFFNAAGAIAILTVLAILLGLVDIMGGQRRRRR